MRVLSLALATFALASGAAAQAEIPLGLGIARPADLSADRPLLFYGSPETGMPLDSLTVREGVHHFEIAYGPPWLDPEVAEMDGDLVSFRVVSLRRHWAEVMVHNREMRWPPKTMWLPRERLQFHPWAAYLLEVYSIETPEAAPIYRGPGASGEPVGKTEAGRPLHVREVRHGWAQVELADAPEAEAGVLGWIRWHDGERLLVRYSVLS